MSAHLLFQLELIHLHFYKEGRLHSGENLERNINRMISINYISF